MFGLPSSLLTGHKGQAGRLSPRLWQKAYGQALATDGAANAYSFFDDFMHFYPVTVTTAAGQLQAGGGYFMYNEADATVGGIVPVATEVGGVIKFTTSSDTSDGDNHDLVLTTQGNVGTMGKVSLTTPKRLIFEAKVKFGSITDGDGSVFVGLTEEGLAAANGVINDSSGHITASKDMIGFLVTEDDNDALKFVYRKAGQAVQTVFTYSTALVASTYYNLGFIYDPDAPASQRIAAYINNVEQGTYITQTMLAAATFPSEEELTLTAAIKNSANNDPQSIYLDLWAFHQAG